MVEIFGTSIESLLVLLALLGRGLVVGERGGEDAGPVLHQEANHGQVVARRSAVQRGPTIRIL